MFLNINQGRIQDFQMEGGGGAKIMFAAHYQRGVRYGPGPGPTWGSSKLLGLTLKRLGGGHDAPPRHIARLLGNAQSSRRDTSWQFSFEFPAHFDTKFVTVPKLRNIVYMHVGPKMAPKCDFVYKINANWVFFHLVHIYMLIFTLNCWN